MNQLQIKKGAHFSEDKTHRFFLYRIWDDSKPFVMFIGLNPSVADSDKDDPTIKSVMRIASNNGYGGIYMVNCFSYISTIPSQMKMSNESEIAKNNGYILYANSLCNEVVFAWGNFDVVIEKCRDKWLTEMFPNAKCLGKNNNGSPKHPLYIKKDTIFKPFNQ